MERIVHFPFRQLALMGMVVSVAAAGTAEDATVRLSVNQEQGNQERNEQDWCNDKAAEK